MRITALKRLAFLLFFFFLFVSNLFASTFVVKKIEISGLSRVSKSTALSYLPVSVGESFNTSDSSKVIDALYQTGFFSKINLSEKNDTLVINVVERPTISSLTITGNKLIATKDLTKALAGFGVSEGLVYDPALLENIKQSLEKQYYDQGNYNAKVKVIVTPVKNNRVNLEVKIDEGNPAKVEKITIIGNHAFNQKTLVKQFDLKTSGFIANFTKKSQYSSEKLDKDLASLKSFYMDHGYIEFRVDSSQVNLSPDKQKAYIVVHVTEGSRYTLSGYQLKGDLLYPETSLKKVMTLQSGGVFSRKDVTNNALALTNFYGDKGYAFAKIQPVPQINSKNHTVNMVFIVDPGKKVYVRQINFYGNAKTEDKVLRRAMRQEEGSLASTSNIQESKRRLQVLGYFKTVTITPKPVAGTDDQVDLDVDVKEAPSATLTAGIGYSDTDGLLLNAGFNQPNFLGTGKNLGVNFNTSDFERYYSINYFNPYHTQEGIGRGFNLYAQTTDTDNGDVDISTYDMDQYGATVNYSIPFTENNSFTYGFGYQISRVKLGDDPSQELVNFFNGTNEIPNSAEAQRDEETFNNVIINGGWNYVGFDQGIFPTKGFGQSLNVQLGLPGSTRSDEQNYYKVNYLAHLYVPITHGFVASFRAELGYANGILGTDYLPFYENYYAGGIGNTGAVRGYEGYSIGPQDSNYDTFGGNAMASGTVALVIPTGLLSPETFRLTTFLDFGNVYDTDGLATTTGSGPMRFSVGIQGEWRSPIGPLILSLAEPINAQDTDEREPLQFTVGTSF